MDGNPVNRDFGGTCIILDRKHDEAKSSENTATQEPYLEGTASICGRRTLHSCVRIRSTLARKGHLYELARPGCPGVVCDCFGRAFPVVRNFPLGPHRFLVGGWPQETPSVTMLTSTVSPFIWSWKPL